jgi:hypothetical protein
VNKPLSRRALLQGGAATLALSRAFAAAMTIPNRTGERMKRKRTLVRTTPAAKQYALAHVGSSRTRSSLRD